MNTPKSNRAPDVLLLLAPECTACTDVLHALGELVKRAVVGRLEIVNIAARPEVAEQLAVRSVPWIRIGTFELSGAHTQTELERWAQRAGTDVGVADYFAELLKSGALQKVIEYIKRDANGMNALLLLPMNPDSELHVRIGVGAVLEEFQGGPVLSRHVNTLGALSRHGDARVRADACHYLALTGQADAAAYVQHLLTDNDPQVREIAQESLAILTLGDK